jgi:adenylate cyclase
MIKGEASMHNTLERRLQGSRMGYMVAELFTNSIHFPLANIILELLLRGGQPLQYFGKPDPYILLAGSLLQAVVRGNLHYRGQGWRFSSNLIGVSVYTIFEFLAEGLNFLQSPNHLAYWGFSLIIGLLQAGSFRLRGHLTALLIFLEHVVRTNILLITYWLFEVALDQGTMMFDLRTLSLRQFLTDQSHQYITIILLLLGCVIGFANITAVRYLQLLRDTARTLQRYSEWFFGRELLSQAVTDVSVLTLQRRERTVMFMDIRGFTSWSETHTPEEVVTMLNTYFATAAPYLPENRVIKVKYTGDEILAVFATAEDALQMVLPLRTAISSFLSAYHLAAGIGMHSGPLVEGLIGSQQVKAYDIIGDTVNTGKRICDQAAGGEILISQACYEKLRDIAQVNAPRTITAKGKKETLEVYPVQSLQSQADYSR